MKKHVQSFQNAICGLSWAVKTQPHLRFHILAMLAITAAVVYFEVTITEYLIILVMITGVLVTELLNTSLEAATDAHKVIKSTPEEDRLIGLAKDVAAGAVLVMALGAVVVGLVIFIPHLLPV